MTPKIENYWTTKGKS